MKTKTYIRLSALTGAALVSLLCAADARAGFEWDAGINDSAAAPAPEAPGNLSPMPSYDFPGMTARPVAPVEMMPASPAATPSYDAGEVIQGFGSDLPLALALGQVVPARFGYSFGAGVDPATRVSWMGGKPWLLIVQDMLRPAGLSAQMGSSSVMIERTGTPTTISSMPLPPQNIAPVTPYSALTPSPMMAQNAPMPIMEPSVMTPMPQGYNQPSYPSVIPAPVAYAPSYGMPCLTGAAAPQGPIVRHATAAKALSMNEIRNWTAPRGAELLSVLTQWTDNAGGTLYWKATASYIIPDDIRLSGTFAEAVGAVLSAFDASTPRPVGKLHPNAPKGPAVLVIEDSSN